MWRWGPCDSPKWMPQVLSRSTCPYAAAGGHSGPPVRPAGGMPLGNLLLDDPFCWMYPNGWMVCNGKFHKNWWFRGTPILGNLHISIHMLGNAWNICLWPGRLGFCSYAHREAPSQVARKGQLQNESVAWCPGCLFSSMAVLENVFFHQKWKKNAYSTHQNSCCGSKWWSPLRGS